MAAITTLRGDLELRARLGPLTADDAEFVSVSPDLDTWPGAREGALRRLREGGAARARKLFGPGVLARERDRRLLTELAARGTAVRIARGPLPQGTVFVGGRTMILTDPSARRTYLMSAEPALVAGAFALFEAAWRSATDLGELLAGRPVVDERARPVLRALGSGLTDEAAARGLGMSLRTYRRRVAELLVALDAESRFQAGVRAGEWGLSRG
ncbi:DNA-binding response regulator [Streptomyces sp. NPDC004539]|uniref:DNA-binding response regulator n=1 Tax=Streptomyces sp. NPDC004539 TaxID=3154280 RepID=UPI0033BA9145